MFIFSLCQSHDASPTQSHDASPARLAIVEEELKRLREEKHQSTVAQILQQVRTLARRPTTSNDVLIASLENLYDEANLTGHEDTELFKTTLQACRTNFTEGQLHGLITKLIGTEAAKKAQAAIDQWRRAEAKSVKTPATSEATSKVEDPKVDPFKQEMPFQFPQFLSSYLC